MSLTLHINASDGDHLYTTLDSVAGVHTGSPPGDSTNVEVWEEETGVAILTNVIFRWYDGRPVWRSTSSPMVLPCLHFDGSITSMALTTQNAGTYYDSTAIVTVSTFTILVAFRATLITSAAATNLNHCLVGDQSGYWGVFLRNASGQRKVGIYTYPPDTLLEFDINEATNYVFMGRHDGVNLYASLNGGTESSFAAGNRGNVGGLPLLGHGYSSSAFYNGDIGELKIWNDGTANGALTTEISAMTTKWLAAAAVSSFVVPTRAMRDVMVL